jgi:hypothetical protein
VKNVDEMEILRDFCAEATPPEPQLLAPIRAKVVAGFDAGPLPHARRRQRRRFGPPYLALTGGVAVLAAAAMATTLVITTGAGGAGPASGPVQLDAAVVLHRAAEAALSEPAPGTGPFIYAQVISLIDGSQAGTGESAHRGFSLSQKLWVSVTGTRPSTISAPHCSPGPILSTRQCAARRLEPGFFTFTYADLEKLPTAPGALLDYLYSEQSASCRGTDTAAISRAQREWAAIYVIMIDVPMLPPRFAAALFTAAAQIPGVTVIRNVTNAAGQTGIAVERTVALTERVAGPAVRHPYSLKFSNRLELIFSPHSYRSIGITDIFQQQGAPASTSATAVTGARLVTTAPAAPGPGVPGDRDSQCGNGFVWAAF